MQHIKRSKENNYIIISINTQKAFGEIQKPSRN
jgi:hypothetical protein